MVPAYIPPVLIYLQLYSIQPDFLIMAFQYRFVCICTVFAFILGTGIVEAQNNYEIQVYASPTQAKGSTMFELHSNYTFNGSTQTVNGVLPSNHSLHETVEITTGITSIFETGVYLFMNYTPGYGYQIVGAHLRPRFMAPDSWHLPVGLSLSMEIGYQKPDYADDEWSLEI